MPGQLNPQARLFSHLSPGRCRWMRERKSHFVFREVENGKKRPASLVATYEIGFTRCVLRRRQYLSNPIH
jgi:hypothetical protein